MVIFRIQRKMLFSRCRKLEGFPHVSQIERFVSVWLCCSDCNNDHWRAVIFVGAGSTESESDSTTTTAAASAAGSDATTATATGCAYSALSRCSTGPGAHRLDLSARSGDGCALVRKKFGRQRPRTRGRYAEATLGCKHQRIDGGPSGSRDDERKAGLDQPARRGISGAAR